MILNTIIMVEEALKHDTFGINRVLDQMPRDTNTPKPPTVSVVSQVSDDDAARDESPADFPVLVVTSETPMRAEGEIESRNERDATIPIVIRYSSADAESAALRTEVLLVLRAVLYTLDELTRESNAAVVANRNGVFIISKNVIFAGAAGGIEEEPLLFGAVTTEFVVRDTFKLP